MQGVLILWVLNFLWGLFNIVTKGQLGINNKNQNLKTFEKSIIFTDREIIQVEGHLAQSVALLSKNFFSFSDLKKIKGDGQIVSWGYIFDSLTTNRILSFYKNFPRSAQWWQSAEWLLRSSR